MRVTFEAGTERDAALGRVRGLKSPGRKHNHQPRGRAHQHKLMRPIRRQELVNALHRKFSTRVAAYFRGEMENYPAGISVR